MRYHLHMLKSIPSYTQFCVCLPLYKCYETESFTLPEVFLIIFFFSVSIIQIWLEYYQIMFFHWYQICMGFRWGPDDGSSKHFLNCYRQHNETSPWQSPTFKSLCYFLCNERWSMKQYLMCKNGFYIEILKYALLKLTAFRQFPICRTSIKNSLSDALFISWSHMFTIPCSWGLSSSRRVGNSSFCKHRNVHASTTINSYTNSKLFHSAHSTPEVPQTSQHSPILADIHFHPCDKTRKLQLLTMFLSELEWPCEKTRQQEEDVMWRQQVTMTLQKICIQAKFELLSINFIYL